MSNDTWLAVPEENTSKPPLEWGHIPQITIADRLRGLFVKPRLDQNNEPSFGPDGEVRSGINRRTLLFGAGTAALIMSINAADHHYQQTDKDEREAKELEAIHAHMVATGLSGIDSVSQNIDTAQLVDLETGNKTFSMGGISATRASVFDSIEMRPLPSDQHEHGATIVFRKALSDGDGVVAWCELAVYTPDHRAPGGFAVREILAVLSRDIRLGSAQIKYLGVEKQRTYASTGQTTASTGFCVRNDGERLAMTYSPEGVVVFKPGDEEYSRTAMTTFDTYRDLVS